MYLTTRKNRDGSDFYVYAAETRRDEAGKNHTVLVRSFGLKSVMDAKRPGLYERLEKHYERIRERSAYTKEKFIDNHMLQSESEMNDVINRNEIDYLVDELSNPLLSYALMPLRRLWDKDFKLTYKFDYLQKKVADRSKTGNAPEYSINEIAFYLAASRLIDPCSISKIMERRNQFISDWMAKFSLSDVYRCLDYLHDFKEELLKHLNKRFEELVPNRNYRMVFYDVTNFYMETSLTDEERQYLDPVGVSKHFDLLEPYFDNNGRLHIDIVPDEILEQVRKDIFLKGRGISKEMRTDLPLVSLVLMIDEHGLPIDFEIFSGNTSEFKSMPEAIACLKNKYGVDNNVVVADRGLNSASNLDMLCNMNYGFIIAQKFSSITKKIKDEYKLLDLKTYTIVKDQKGQELFRYKCIDNYVKTGTSSPEPITCKLIVTWSETRDKRDKRQFEADKQRAEAAIDDNKKLYQKTRSWQRLVTTKDESGEGTKAKKLNDAQVKKREEECGFAAFVYKNPPNKDNELNIEEIMGSYHSLVEIEACFRLLKHNLDLRPAFVWNPIHIRAHILLCYLSLCMFKRLLISLTELGLHPTPDQVQDALNDAFVMVQKINETREQGVIFHKTRLSSPSLTISELDSNGCTTLTGKELSSYLKDHPEDIITNINHIMMACGLTPLPPTTSRISISKCLGRRFAKLEDMMAPERVAEVQRMFKP